jgi:hypothetical protein
MMDAIIMAEYIIGGAVILAAVIFVSIIMAGMVKKKEGS